MTKKLFAVLALFVPLCVLAASPASAEQTVRWSISAEEWVVGVTAEITVQVSVAANTVDAASQAAYGTVEELRKATRWEWQSLGRGGNYAENRAGMAEWVLEARARAPLTELETVFQLAKDLSVPGRRVLVANTDLSPSLEEMEAGREKLRAAMIGTAQTQAGALKATLKSIDFAPGMAAPIPMPPMLRTMGAEMSMSGSAPAPRAGAVRIVETAVVEVTKQ